MRYGTSSLLSYLNDLGWIDLRGSSFGNRRATVTVAGYSRIEEQITNVDPSQAFVAMWFGDSMNDVSRAEAAVEAVSATRVRTIGAQAAQLTGIEPVMRETTHLCRLV